MTIFRANVGGLDRVVRLVAGAVLLLAGLALHDQPASFVMMVAGAAGLFSGLTRFCVLYVPFGISTRRKRVPAI